MSLLSSKLEQATGILRDCIGNNGVWADPTRYRNQCWTRDFVIAIMPVLLDLGETKIVKTHLHNLSRRQRSNGQIPILFLDRTLPFLKDKVRRSFADGRLSFMLNRWLRGELWNLTPGTRDSEILYIIGMCEYARQTGDQSLMSEYDLNVNMALRYIERNLMNLDGLVMGCDWRDTMERELGDKTLLTNNSLLYHAYKLLGRRPETVALSRAIQTRLCPDGTYLDYPGNDRFDPLGGALAVLYDVATPEQYPNLVASFRSVDTPLGVSIKCRHNPISAEEKAVIERTDGVVVWPFVVGFSILALVKMQALTLAQEQFEKITALEGFREWYDPTTGKGYGAMQQLWSATLFLRSAAPLNGK